MRLRKPSTASRTRTVFATGAMVATLLGGAIAAAPSAAAAATPVCTTTTTGYWSDSPTYSWYPYHKNPNTVSCTLYQGVKSTGVKALQKNLNQCYGKKLQIDGSFGPATKAALRDVQSRVGAAVDGVYGPETRNKMKWGKYHLETGARTGCYTFNT
ncbi:peptidoglycan-binding domain-containing protein [Streptomyces sp. NPDC020875]|uniref:peptidoglycan-binding domain-containing protein n=1 Tax=Streptomyces sp. NPDC020875 TaxID=3154898 RepID=UPI0033C2356C